MCPEVLKVNCPNCGREVVRARPSEAPFFPFCCERCKLIDLGKWLDEQHRIEEPLEPGAGASGGA
ncbi:MAG: hypothetical protein AMK73_00595 [Planctomycetes bacterium SM23_32]|nr:MAG: hypothetical protein AMK73_00595 [Planctomycetes bacterium SM23_32]